MRLKRYLPEFVYGGIDGAVTTFAVVCGSMGAALSPAIVLILGFANLFADGFSMAVSNYLSSKSQMDLHIDHEDYETFKKLEKHPVKAGFATFFSFVLIGFIPLLSFCLSFFFPSLVEYQFSLSIFFTAIALLIVGGVKGEAVNDHSILKSALETLLIGGIAAILAFLVGYWLKGILI